MDLRVGSVAGVRRDGCRVVEVDGRAIGVIAAGEDFFAIRDRCPHMGPSLCRGGSLNGTFLPAGAHELVYGRHERVIRCPWHGWEFDLETGRSLLQPDRVGVKTYPVHVRDGQVYVEV